MGNRYSDTITVIPVTSSTQKIYPFETGLSAGDGGLKRDSKAKANHIRTIDKQSLVQRIGPLSAGKLSEVERAV